MVLFLPDQAWIVFIVCEITLYDGDNCVRWIPRKTGIYVSDVPYGDSCLRREGRVNQHRNTRGLVLEFYPVGDSDVPRLYPRANRGAVCFSGVLFWVVDTGKRSISLFPGLWDVPGGDPKDRLVDVLVIKISFYEDRPFCCALRPCARAEQKEKDNN